MTSTNHTLLQGDSAKGLAGKHIVLGITGSIAAYKACILIRALIKRGAEVQVVITPAGKEFITPITLSALTHKPVISEFFSQRDGTWNSHVDLGLWADAMVIAPCTASTLGKMAHGVADNMLITTYLSMKAPVFIAPAMDLDMYRHPSTQANLQTLRSYGNTIIEPASGFLASGLEGKGRMEEPEVIATAIAEALVDQQNNSLSPLPSPLSSLKKVLITAGPTYERIDPVRFIGNYSSGKMGFALAEECLHRGFDVTLVTGPTALKCSEGIRRIDVESCQEMLDASSQVFDHADIAIFCAAVADYRPAHPAEEKLKRTEDNLAITLAPNPDIAATLGQRKHSGQLTAVFALETDDGHAEARRKLEKKNADIAVLNTTRNAGTTFGSDDNQVTIISRTSEQSFPKKPKQEVAKDIIDSLLKVKSEE